MHAAGTIENSRGFNPFELSKVFRQSDGEAMSACPKKVLTNYGRGCKLSKLPVFSEIFQISGRKKRPAPAVHAAGRDWKIERTQLAPKGLTSC